jgi:hypothetical protein
MTSRASVGYTSVRIAIPPICFGHIDRRIERLADTRRKGKPLRLS